MIEVKLVTDFAKVKELCNACGICDTDRKNIMAATDKGEVLAYSVFFMDENSMTICRVVPTNDYLLADGIIRSTMHIAVTRGIDKLYYTDDVDEKMLSTLRFIKQKEEKLLDCQVLFKDKCCGK